MHLWKNLLHLCVGSQIYNSHPFPLDSVYYKSSNYISQASLPIGSGSACGKPCRGLEGIGVVQRTRISPLPSLCFKCAQRGTVFSAGSHRSHWAALAPDVINTTSSLSPPSSWNFFILPIAGLTVPCVLFISYQAFAASSHMEFLILNYIVWTVFLAEPWLRHRFDQKIIL